MNDDADLIPVDGPYAIEWPSGGGSLTITITLSPHEYQIYIGKSDEPKLPPDYNPTRKHWQSPRYIPKRRK